MTPTVEYDCAKHGRTVATVRSIRSRFLLGQRSFYGILPLLRLAVVIYSVRLSVRRIIQNAMHEF